MKQDPYGGEKQTSVDKNVEKSEPSNIAVQLIGKTLHQSLKMLTIELLYDLQSHSLVYKEEMSPQIRGFLPWFYLSLCESFLILEEVPFYTLPQLP